MSCSRGSSLRQIWTQNQECQAGYESNQLCLWLQVLGVSKVTSTDNNSSSLVPAVVSGVYGHCVGVPYGVFIWVYTKPRPLLGWFCSAWAVIARFQLNSGCRVLSAGKPSPLTLSLATEVRVPNCKLSFPTASSPQGYPMGVPEDDYSPCKYDVLSLPVGAEPQRAVDIAKDTHEQQENFHFFGKVSRNYI